MDYSSNPTDHMHPTTGKHTAGDPSAGIPATIDRPEHMNAVYDEILNVITFYGLTPNENILTQLRQAIQAAIAAAVTPDATTAVKGKIELATQPEMDAGTDPTRVPPVNVVATYVAARIAALVASSPATLDTLNELAEALGDDPNFATTIATALAGKAALAHNHDAADLTSGTLDAARLPAPTTTARGGHKKATLTANYYIDNETGYVRQHGVVTVAGGQWVDVPLNIAYTISHDHAQATYADYDTTSSDSPAAFPISLTHIRLTNPSGDSDPVAWESIGRINPV